MSILITGSAGFIGYHLSMKLIDMEKYVIGIDNINDYYDVQLKKDRIDNILQCDNSNLFFFKKMDLCDKESLLMIFEEFKIDIVINLAAQPGVRYSLINPDAYIQSNIVGFVNLLECCRKYKIEHLIYASSSSVYGLNEKRPYSVHDNVNHQISLYAATKKSDELLAHVYSYLFEIPSTGLRFFTVYGPWGRPDMSPYLFTTAILNHQPIQLFNNGKMQRDFTYIDDIVSGIVSIINHPPKRNYNFDFTSPDPAKSSAPWTLYNIGNNHVIELIEFIHTLEDILGIKAEFKFLPMQQGDVESTWADMADFLNYTGYLPTTRLRDGLQIYIEWYKNYYLK